MRPETITETMQHPAFTPEQLPELWQQIETDRQQGIVPDNTRNRWNNGIEAMYRRCETYPQHAKLAVVLSGLPPVTWHNPLPVLHQGHNLLEQATPEQLLQALKHEQTHPEGWWTASNHILTRATTEQLTGPVIEQLQWEDGILDWATTPKNTAATHNPARDPARPLARIQQRETALRSRCRHIVEHIQQHLLAEDSNAWNIFLGIVEPETIIGDTAELAHAIEH